jgi:hypothetical protein
MNNDFPCLFIPLFALNPCRREAGNLPWHSRCKNPSIALSQMPPDHPGASPNVRTGSAVTPPQPVHPSHHRRAAVPQSRLTPFPTGDNCCVSPTNRLVHFCFRAKTSAPRLAIPAKSIQRHRQESASDPQSRSQPRSGHGRLGESGPISPPKTTAIAPSLSPSTFARSSLSARFRLPTPRNPLTSATYPPLAAPNPANRMGGL